MKIQATVITGFLGSGKTTLIRHLIVRAEGRRLALIINEFGDLGFDREALLGDDGMGGKMRNAGCRAIKKMISWNWQTAVSAAPWPMISCPPSRR